MYENQIRNYDPENLMRDTPFPLRYHYSHV